jgi:hypothetical protein
VARPGERLFEFLRASGRAPMSCELRFNGESYGWEAQFFERGELPYSRGGFVTRALAVQWAEKERTTMDVVSAVRAGAAVGHAAASVARGVKTSGGSASNIPTSRGRATTATDPAIRVHGVMVETRRACRRISSA